MQHAQDTVYKATGLAMVHHALGNQQESDQALKTLIASNSNDAGYQIAEVYAFRGELDHAFKWLEHSYVIRDSGLAFTIGDPAFQSLHKDPRWEKFLEKLGLLEAWRGLPPEFGGPKP